MALLEKILNLCKRCTDDSLCLAIIALNANTSLACDMMTCLWHTYSLSLDIHPLICWKRDSKKKKEF